MPTRRPNGQGVTPYTRKGQPGIFGRVRLTNPITGETSRPQVHAPSGTKKELDRKIRKLLADAEAGRLPTNGRAKTITLAEYAQVWSTEYLPAREVAGGTILNYRAVIKNHIVPAIGSVRVPKLGRGHIEKLHVAIRAKGLGKSTERMVYNVLKQILDAAVSRDKLLFANPVSDMKRPKEARRRQPRYSIQECERLFAACKGEPVLEHLVPFLTWTGLRIGEALALRWSDDVDFEAMQVWVQGTEALDEDGHIYRKDEPKDDDYRPLPLVPPALKALKAARVAQAEQQLAVGEAWQNHDLVFTTSIGTLIDSRNLRNRYRPIVAALGLKGSFHSLRRSTGTLLTKSGVPLNVVSAILGHSDSRITEQTYAIADTEIMADALKQVMAYWTATTGTDLR